MSDNPADGPPAHAAPEPPRPPRRSAADDFQPDVPADARVGTVAPLVPGASIADGRYRLLVFHGGTAALRFWQALDTALDRQVALTFVDPDQLLPAGAVHEILSRTLRLGRIDLPGIARVLDVVHTDAGGLVVSEWVRGGSLREVADTAPSPLGVARAVQSLATAAEAAHRAGVALSIDHPGRVRVSIDGNVTLAFPATMPDADPADDIRGIGATLYALLVNRWPLPETGADAGLAPADRDPAGQPVSPDTVNPAIPFQIAAAASRSIQPDGGIRSAAMLSNLLEQAATVAERTELLGPVDQHPPPRAPAQPDEAVLARRRRNVLIGVGVGAAILLVALLVLVSLLNRIFGDVRGFDRAELGLNNPSATAVPNGSTAPAGSTVKPLRATVFSPGGEADAPQDAGLAIDGNPTTFWPTDTYHDPVPFPNFKSGVGLILQLPEPTVVGAVNITVAGTGTKVEIRSSSTPNPARLEDTTALTSAKLVAPGPNRIAVNTTAPTSNLLVWISTLGIIDGDNRAEIFEITVQAAE